MTEREICLEASLQQREEELLEMRKRLDNYEHSDTTPPPPTFPESLVPQKDDTGRTRIDELANYVQAVEYIKGALDGIQAHLASEEPPKWAGAFFDALSPLGERLGKAEAAIEEIGERLARLPCWRQTLPPHCPNDETNRLSYIPGDKGGE
jgi:hypothetical protein